jgi:gluconolactonase
MATTVAARPGSASSTADAKQKTPSQQPLLPVLRPHHFGISVPDLDAAIDWYQHMLGFALEARLTVAQIPANIAFLRRDQYRLEIFEVAGANALPEERRVPDLDLRTHGNKHMCFEVPDVAQAVTSLRAQGADIAKELCIDGNATAFIRDISGNLIELLEPFAVDSAAATRGINPLRGWQVQRDEIRMVGHDLSRPECILAEADGTLWTADGRGGVMRIDADGTQTLIAQQHENGATEAPAVSDTQQLVLGKTLPNGLAFDRDGNIVIANFGTDAIELMARDGSSRTLHDNIDGQPLGKANFVLTDSQGRIWFSVTTRQVPWTRSINEKTADGYVGLIDQHGIRIVADGFVGTNEIRLDAKEEWLYVVETNARHISRLRVGADGALSAREVFGPDDLGGFPDGFAFDAYGNLWITLILNEQLIALTPEGELLKLLDDCNPEALARYQEHYAAGTTTPELMGACRGTLAPMMASITFGGADLRTVYLGSLAGTRLASFRSPVPGLPLQHWKKI